MKGQETAKAAAMFEEYCAMGTERSLEKLRVYLGKNPSYKRQLELYSSKFSWQARVKQYDARLADEARQVRLKERRVREEKLEAERTRMNEEHALLGRTHALRAAKRIQELMDTQNLGSQASVLLLKYATDLERVARGAETEITKNTTPQAPAIQQNMLLFDLSKLTMDQLGRLEALAQELEG